MAASALTLVLINSEPLVSLLSAALAFPDAFFATAFLAVAFLAVVALAAVFFAVLVSVLDFVADVFAVATFVVDFFATAFLAAGLAAVVLDLAVVLAATFFVVGAGAFAAVFLAATFLAAVFLLTVFLAAVFLVATADVFLATAFFFAVAFAAVFFDVATFVLELSFLLTAFIGSRLRWSGGLAFVPELRAEIDVIFLCAFRFSSSLLTVRVSRQGPRNCSATFYQICSNIAIKSVNYFKICEKWCLILRQASHSWSEAESSLL